MRTKHAKRSTSKGHRSLRKKSGGGWFDSSPDDANNKPWHEKASDFLANLFSSAPPVPQNAPPPPRPGQPPAPAPVQAPRAPQATATAPGPGPQVPATPKFGSDTDQFGSNNAKFGSDTDQFGSNNAKFGSPSDNNVAFGGRRRRSNKNKNKTKNKKK